ncbi:MAG: nicotinate (nicotinamide) nucleotide adenylyltransferase [Planctomycetota bacterium]
MSARILYGGSFDPPQTAHRFVATQALAHLPEAELVVIPAGDPPHKPAAELAPCADRVAMCRLAFAGLEHGRVSDEECRLPGPHYTYLALERHRAELGADVPLYWLCGSDSLLALPGWKHPRRILELCDVICVPRPGFDPDRLAGFDVFDAHERARLQAGVLPGEAPEVSATEVRRRLSAGEPCGEWLSPEVFAYARARGLYGSGGVG